MNKPATKEPSMDEILSSIRQIIADDDAASAPAPQPPRPAAPPLAPIAAAPKPAPAPPRAEPAPPSEPLALSAAQIVQVAAPAPMPEAAPPETADFSAMLAGLEEDGSSQPMSSSMPASEAELLDPEDIAFEAEPEPEPEPEPAAPPPRAVTPMPEPRPAPRSVAQAAPMPDPHLSSDIAEQLLAPATDAAVQGTMARLSAMQDAGIGGLTVEAMIRQMLRPMLKDWLDENLPAMVERLVEKEIARISRGVK